MIDNQVLAFALVAALVTMTPGVDMMLVVRNVLRGGRRDGIVTTFGICAGLFLHAALSALGISMVLLHSAMAFNVVKIAGAIYLVWLGLRSLAGAFRRQSSDDSDSGQSLVPIRMVSRRQCLLEGFLSNILNPKVAMFYLAFLPQFISAADSVLTKSALLAGIHYAEGIVWLVTLSFVVDRGRRVFIRSALRRWLDRLCGLALIGLGTRLALERR